MADFTLTSLRGGYNDTDPPIALLPDQCTDAVNVEFNRSTLGERRRGCTELTSMPASFSGANMQACTFLHRHLPTTDETAAELWAMAQHLTTQNYALERKDTTWHSVTPVDDIDVTNNRGFSVYAQTLHGKLFFAYKSVGSVARLHVWDGTTLRRTGLAQPVLGPAVANSVPGGTYANVRYFRTRYTVQAAGITLLRSEPSPTTTFTPGGANNGAVITKPATIGEAETHWEVEASSDNANFYRIQTLVVATTTYTDTTTSSSYRSVTGAVLSADIGDYSLISSGKYLVADEDRLLIGGDYEDPTRASTVRWTPAANDPGQGNDERIPLDTDNELNLDGYEGGGLTGMSHPVNGYVYAFKWSHIYKLVRTGEVLRAYDPVIITKARGAFPGSIVSGVDQSGNPCLYFLDPKVGPCRLGPGGLRTCSGDILTTWRTVNLDALVPARVVFYPESRQVHWWIATNGSTTPNLKIVLQTNESTDGNTGVRKGWATATGRIATAYAACMFADNIDAGVARSMILRPFIGLATWTVGASTIHNIIQRCDTGARDGFTAGDTVNAYYFARVRSKPYFPAGLLNKFGVGAGALLAKAAAGVVASVRCVRDFGLETKTVSNIPLDPTAAAETHVIKPLDNMTFSTLTMLQMEMGDLDLTASPVGSWELNMMALKERKEQSS